MKTCSIDADKILKVWEWCSDSYLRSGIRLSFPKNTQPDKTYQWRYCKAIAAKFDQWDFDDRTSQRFIDIAVNYAKKTGSLKKGLSILHQKNMLDSVYDMMKEESISSDGSIDVLIHTKRWIDRQVGDDNPLSVMLNRIEADSVVNIVIWHQANKLPALYIALSKNCCKALARLKKQQVFDRDLLPKMTELYKLRLNFINKADNLDKAREILGKDWRELCH